MHDSFIVVKKKRNRKQSNPIDVQNTLTPEAIISRKLKKAIEDFESSQFWWDTLAGINSCLELLKQDSINQILCYGIGNFSESKSSQHQLAGLVTFQKRFNCFVKIYDPVFTSEEAEFLKNLTFEVLTENIEGKQQIQKNLVTLVFLPHCPKQLTNNFLWANWNTNLHNCILLSNSFTKIIQDNTTKELKEFANYILKIQPKTEEFILENSYTIENIFNDLSIHCFFSLDLTSSFFKETLGEEPVYSQDTELVTKDSSNKQK